jgi:hypothetical protein
MAWVGLSEGPYRRWRTPQGKTIGVNFGEHTVVLTGIRGNRVLLKRSTWRSAADMGHGRTSRNCGRASAIVRSACS